MNRLHKLLRHPRHGWRIVAAIGVSAWGLLAYLMLTDPAAAERAPGPLPDGVELVLNCGTLKGNGTAVVRIYGRTFALLNIACEQV
jgi:hypothetical protein